jgi:hypothetical protein
LATSETDLNLPYGITIFLPSRKSPKNEANENNKQLSVHCPLTSLFSLSTELRRQWSASVEWVGASLQPTIHPN